MKTELYEFENYFENGYTGANFEVVQNITKAQFNKLFKRFEAQRDAFDSVTLHHDEYNGYSVDSVFYTFGCSVYVLKYYKCDAGNCFK